MAECVNKRTLKRDSHCNNYITAPYCETVATVRGPAQRRRSRGGKDRQPLTHQLPVCVLDGRQWAARQDGHFGLAMRRPTGSGLDQRSDLSEPYYRGIVLCSSEQTAVFETIQVAAE